jgi:hypothetical protein
MKFCLLFLLGFPCLLLGLVTWTDDSTPPFKIQIDVDPPQLNLGNSFSIDLKIDHPVDYQCDFDSLIANVMWSANPLEPSFLFINSTLSPPVIEEKNVKQHLVLHLRPLKIGALAFSFFSFSFTSTDALLTPTQFLTPFFKVEVSAPHIEWSVLPIAPVISLSSEFPLGLTQANQRMLMENPQQLSEQQKQIEDRLALERFPWLLLITATGFAGIGWLAYLMSGFFTGKELNISQPSGIDRWNAAFDRLKQFQQMNTKEVQIYGEEFSQILNQLIEALLNQPLKSMTLEEIKKLVQKNGSLSELDRQALLHGLSLVEDFKFKQQVSPLEKLKEAFYLLENRFNRHPAK